MLEGRSQQLMAFAAGGCVAASPSVAGRQGFHCMAAAPPLAADKAESCTERASSSAAANLPGVGFAQPGHAEGAVALGEHCCSSQSARAHALCACTYRAGVQQLGGSSVAQHQ